MNDHVWDTRALHHRSAANARPRGPGRYVGTRWQPAGLPVPLRLTLQAAAVAIAFLLLMGFYSVVRGAVARGPAVLAPAPAAAPADVPNAAAPGTWDCSMARPAICGRTTKQPVSAATRHASFDVR